MSKISKIWLLVLLLVAIPLVPFLLWEESLERGCREWLQTYGNAPLPLSLATIFLLTTDLFLPIPSSVLSVLLARTLTTHLTPSWLGLLATVGVLWTGMTCGALLAWGLGKLGGERLARKLAGEDDFLRLQQFSEKYGAWILIWLRAVPLFAEASVLVLSVSGVRFWRVFFLPVAWSNLGIALVYGLLGHSENGLPLGVVVLASILLPVTVSWIAKKVLKKNRSSAN
ncbi:MAG: VTT domain-containing protein [Planctomycetia bacterium]|nr:VTT domain-containing protein [Planctomycetia bacterium]